MNHEHPAGARLHHVALGAHNVDAAATFYAHIFDLHELTRHYERDGSLRSIWLDLGGSILMIEHTDTPLRPIQRTATGPFLLAFSTTPQERHAIEARLDAAGVAIEDRTAFTSYARDPEGNRIAFSHWPYEA